MSIPGAESTAADFNRADEVMARFSRRDISGSVWADLRVEIASALAAARAEARAAALARLAGDDVAAEAARWLTSGAGAHEVEARALIAVRDLLEAT